MTAARFSDPPVLPASPPDPEIPAGDPQWLQKHCAKHSIHLNGQVLDSIAWGVTPTEEHSKKAKAG